jgi:hypothetical protein
MQTPTFTFKTKRAWPLGAADEEPNTTTIRLNVGGICITGNAKHVH